MVDAYYFPDVFQLTTLHPTRTNVHVVELKVDDLQVGHKQDHLFRNTLRGSGSLFSDSQVVDAVQLPKQDESALHVSMTLFKSPRVTSLYERQRC